MNNRAAYAFFDEMRKIAQENRVPFPHLGPEHGQFEEGRPYPTMGDGRENQGELTPKRFKTFLTTVLPATAAGAAVGTGLGIGVKKLYRHYGQKFPGLADPKVLAPLGAALAFGPKVIKMLHEKREQIKDKAYGVDSKRKNSPRR